MDKKQSDLNHWNQLKYDLHSRKDRVPNVRQGEVWWCALGENIGVEINGKSKRHSRPVIIFRKLNQWSMMIVPLTTKGGHGNWYVPFEFKGKKQVAVLSQVKVVAVQRLYDRLGMIDDQDFSRVQRGFDKIYSSRG